MILQPGCHCSPKGKLYIFPKPLSYFRRHPNQNNNTLGLKTFSEWLDIMIASRGDGFLDTNHLFKTALHSYRERVKNYHEFVEDIKQIDMILTTLD